MAIRRPVKLDTTQQSITDTAREFVRQELEKRGSAKIEEERQGRSVRFRVWNASADHQVRIRVRARTTGSWHASLAERDPSRDEQGIETFWVFVDLTPDNRPRFFVVPESWMPRDIHIITKAISSGMTVSDRK